MIGERFFLRLQAVRGWRADLLALGLGAVSAAALPPIYILPALLLAVPGLLALIEGTRGYGGAFRRGFFFGLGHHIFGLYWITEAILLESARYWWLVPLAVPALSALLALFIAAPCAVAKRAQPGWRRVVALAGPGCCSTWRGNMSAPASHGIHGAACGHYRAWRAISCCNRWHGSARLA